MVNCAALLLLLLLLLLALVLGRRLHHVQMIPSLRPARQLLLNHCVSCSVKRVNSSCRRCLALVAVVSAGRWWPSSGWSSSRHVTQSSSTPFNSATTLRHYVKVCARLDSIRLICRWFPGNPAVWGNKIVSCIQAMRLRVRTRLKVRMRVKASTNPLP